MAPNNCTYVSFQVPDGFENGIRGDEIWRPCRLSAFLSATERRLHVTTFRLVRRIGASTRFSSIRHDSQVILAN